MAEEEGDVQWIGPMLSGEADQHEPDITRLIERVMAEVRTTGSGRGQADDHIPPAVRVAETGPRPARRRPVGRRLLPAGLAAAVLATIVTAGSWLPALWGHAPGTPARVIEVGGREAATSAAEAPPASPSSASGAALTGPTSSSTPPTALSTALSTTLPTARSTTLPTATPRPASPGTPPAGGAPITPGSVVMSVQPIAPGSAVALPDAGDRDWLAAAAGFGGGAVRAAHGGREIVGLLPYGSVAPQAVPGPFALAWSEGSPVVRGMSNTWLTETAAGAGFRVSAPSAGTDIGTLVVYAGALGHQAHVTARLDGGGSGASVNLPAPSGAAGYVLTIRFRALRGGDTVLLDLSADPGGGVGMAAIELR